MLLASTVLTLALASRGLAVAPEGDPGLEALRNLRDPAWAASLEDRAAMGEDWSRWLAFWIVPLGPALCAAFGLAAALRHERLRRRMRRPPPGWVAVEGRIGHGLRADEPVVAVSFELERRTYKGSVTYQEKSHHVEVHPFTVATPDGRRIDLRPDRRTIELHAPVEGEGCKRRAAVAAGEPVWVCAWRAQDGAHGEARTLVSTEPIEELSRRDRNRRLWAVASLLGLFAILELACFGSFLDLLSAGRRATGQVVEKSSWLRTSRSRTGSSHSYWVHGVTVTAEGRTETFEVRRAGWELAREGAPVEVLLTPHTMVLGATPYATEGRGWAAVALMLLGVGVYLLIGRVDSAWYSSRRGWRAIDELVPARRSQLTTCPARSRSSSQSPFRR